MTDPLSRRSILLAAATASIAAAAASLAPTRSVRPARASLRTPTTFFLSADGDDAADGTSARSPWRTPARLNDALAKRAVTSGDTVLFRRGDTFAGALRPLADQATDVLRFASYGSGALPVVSTYKYVSGPGSWKHIGGGQWTIDVSAAAAGTTHTGFVSSFATEIGFVLVDGVIRGDRKSTVAELTDEWQFVTRGSTVTVLHDGNPSLGHSVALAVADSIVVLQTGVVLEDLRFTGSGRNGIQTASNAQVDRAVVRHCEVAEIGGGRVNGTGARYGNGIQVWSGSRSVLVEGNTISDCWDVAMTTQGPATVAPPWSDVAFSDNVVDRCMQSFESWTTGPLTDSTAGAECSFTGNTCGPAGTSWSAQLRSDRSGKGTHLLFYRDDVEARTVVSGNHFGPPTQNYLYATPRIPTNLRSNRNVIELTAARRIQFGVAATAATAGDWTATTGLERDSEFRVV